MKLIGAGQKITVEGKEQRGEAKEKERKRKVEQEITRDPKTGSKHRKIN